MCTVILWTKVVVEFVSIERIAAKETGEHRQLMTCLHETRLREVNAFHNSKI